MRWQPHRTALLFSIYVTGIGVKAPGRIRPDLASATPKQMTNGEDQDTVSENTHDQTGQLGAHACKVLALHAAVNLVPRAMQTKNSPQIISHEAC